MSKTCLCVKTEKREAEHWRQLLKEAELLRQDLRILSEDGFLFLPLQDELSAEELPQLPNFPLERRIFKEAKVHSVDWKVTLQQEGQIPGELLRLLPSSFDIIGHVLILKLDPCLLPYKEHIAQVIIRCQNNVGSVAMEDKVEGEFRIRSLKHLAGERNIETTHRENGLQYLLDPAKVYFSPRLATERMRVAMAVQERFATDNVRETVLDLFAGVGPFALLLGKKAPVETVVAVDKNPVAVDYLKVNISLNKLGNVEAVCGDAALYPKELGARGKRFHRIIMNFPSHPDPFFAPALDAAGPGALIHFYRITGHGELDTVKEFLERTATGAGRGIKDIVHRHIRTYSATLSHYAFDVRLE